MGYTSYWSVLRLADDTEFDKKFAEAVEDIKALMKHNQEHLRIPVASWNGEEGTEPEITADVIAFNGVGEDSHESFVVESKSSPFEFCKTDRKPYNLLVCVSLLMLAERLGSERFKFQSDGHWGDADGWDEAVAVYKVVTGRDISEETRAFIRE